MRDRQKLLLYITVPTTTSTSQQLDAPARIPIATDPPQKPHSTKAPQVVLTMGSLLGWAAVGLQLYLILLNRVASVPETIVRFFSFFTILTNILVALCFTSLLLKPKFRWAAFLTKPTSLAAVAVYIVVVGLFYNLILRQLWQPEGLQKWVDEALHSVVPVFYFAYWLRYVPKAGLSWKDVFPWLLYPFGYLLYSLIYGAFSGFYPYPFINVTELGYERVLLNSAVLFAGFFLLSLLLVALAKRVSRRAN